MPLSPGHIPVCNADSDSSCSAPARLKVRTLQLPEDPLQPVPMVQAAHGAQALNPIMQQKTGKVSDNNCCTLADLQDICSVNAGPAPLCAVCAILDSCSPLVRHICYTCVFKRV